MVKNQKGNKSFRKMANVRRFRTIKKFISNRYVLAMLPLLLFGAALYYFQLDYEPPAPLPPPPADALYRKSEQPVEARVQDLLSRMTLEEKLGQMAMADKNSVIIPEDVSRYGLGAVLSGAGAKPDENTAAGWKDMVERLKSQARTSRLGIPIFFGVDATHGHANVPGATVFPHMIGLGASRDSTLVYEVAAATSREVAATGINWNFSPMLDAPEDIRWGRTYESFSSDPSLNARLGAAYVAGAQATAVGNNQVLASAKHYLGVGSMLWNKSNNKYFKIDQGKIPENEETLNSQYILPFKSAVEAGVGTVMVGLADYGDSRIIDNKYLITDKLKSELGFGGFVVTDWYGVYEFSGVSKYQANVKAINAGVDMAMLPFDYKDFLKKTIKAVKRGDIAESRIDDAVSRILTQKFKAGLFEERQLPALDAIGSNEHRALARRAVSSSAVLLKNENGLLPLPKSTKLLVAGSGADNIGRQAGAWTVEWQGIDGNWLERATSILQGMREVTAGHSQIIYSKDGNFVDNVRADVGIAFVSEKPYAEGWGDNENPRLEDEDLQAIIRLKSKVEKLIIVTVTGRPLLMTDQIADADAVVAAWLPGSEGAGLADVLYGDAAFTAKLPLAWPASLQQIPIKSTGDTADGTEPLFPRGFGL